MNDAPHHADLLCICPHTDDAEIALGGTLRLLADRGRRVWVVDLTRGELGSNGTPDERWAEAAEASRILGLAGRAQLELPDGFLSVGEPGQVASVTALIRALKPRWTVWAPTPRRHPDHLAVGPLVEKAAFMARLAAYDCAMPAMRIWDGGEAVPDPAGGWLCEAVFGVCRLGEKPDALFDVSDVWEAKVAALECYRSQFASGPGRRATMINDAEFMQEIERRARSWGWRAGVRHAEALRGNAAPLLGDLPPEVWT